MTVNSLTMNPRLIIETSRWLIALTVMVGITNGLSLNLVGPSWVQQGDDAVFICTTSGFLNSPTILWRDGASIVFLGGDLYSQEAKHSNFKVSSDAVSSNLTIQGAAFEDDGSYSCSASGLDSDTIDLEVEVKSNVSLTVITTTINNTIVYQAACEAIGARPEENVTWTLGNITQTLGIVETDPDVSHHTLWDKRSVFTFPANKENYNQMLTCQVNGHEVSELNWQKSIQLNFHEPPSPDNIMTTFIIADSSLTVSCDLDASKGQPCPAITNYYIFSNGVLIHESTQGENTVSVSLPNVVVEFTCMAGNVFGNATDAITYEPGEFMSSLQ
eukprot:XP_003727158.1 PREDICTED: hemicentin-1 [Strongylocentrotus purpuratus]